MAYLTNLELQNSLFGDDLLFEGILPCESGYAIVTSQPFIEGQPASLPAIDHFFQQFGFNPVGNFSYRFTSAKENITVFDCRPDNIFKAIERSHLFPIDI